MVCLCGKSCGQAMDVSKVRAATTWHPTESLQKPLIEEMSSNHLDVDTGIDVDIILHNSGIVLKSYR